MASMMRPAPGTPAVPMDARVPVKTIMIISEEVRFTPKALATNREQTPMYSAVPSMLMVQPSGSTNEVTSRDSPSFSWQFFILTGSAAAEEQVVKASIMASDMPRKNFTGFTPPMVDASVE